MEKRKQNDVDDPDPNQPYHQFAAKNHGLAAEHHLRALEYLNLGDYQMAAHHAHIAHGFTLHALRHGEEASKRYAEAYGPFPASER
ncbi:MAG: hypothetical protein ABSF50_11755 [Burkholderiaceae bacterium]|jgi:hypothetical protein